jgi:molybdopterin synthase sulfur carrier subunit
VSTVRLFAQAREAAGAASVSIPGSTVGQVLDTAIERFGSEFAAVLEVSNVWVNGEPSSRDSAVGDDDEVAVLPPVSGGG